MCNSTGIYHRVVLRSENGANPVLKTPLPDRKYRLKVEQVIFNSVPTTPAFLELVFDNLQVQNTYDTFNAQRFSVFVPPVRANTYFLESPTTPVIIERPPGHIVKTNLYDHLGARVSHSFVAVLCFEEMED